MPTLGARGAFLGIRQGRHRTATVAIVVRQCRTSALKNIELKLLPVLPHIEDLGKPVKQRLPDALGWVFYERSGVRPQEINEKRHGRHLFFKKCMQFISALQIR